MVRRPLSGRAAVLAVVLLLGACAEGTGPPPATGSSGTDAILAALPPDAATPTPSEPAIRDPAKLVGLGARDVAGLLGAPGFRRKDDPAEVWQYQTQGCFLDVFLYADKAGGETYSVAHVEVRPRRSGGISKEDCLRAVLQGRKIDRSG